MLKSVEKVMQTPDLDKMIREKLLRKVTTRTGSVTKIPIGDLVAGISPTNPDNVIIGFSLCHKNMDRYDYIENGRVRVPGFGKKLAISRAIKWEEKSNFDVPDSMSKPVQKFIERCKKYYKDKNVPNAEEYFPDENIVILDCGCMEE